MAVVEIRCPRCGSVSHLKNEKTHEYSCDHCHATFLIVYTTKREVVRDIKRHNCPVCGRPVKMDESYVCIECGKEDLCKNCIKEVDEKNYCGDCIEKLGWACSSCSSPYTIECEVCGRKSCKTHSIMFDIMMEKYSKKSKRKRTFYQSLYCDKCKGWVCSECYEEKRSLLGGRTYICKKCKNELKLRSPIMDLNKNWNDSV
jgi:hypothetical protein